MEISLEEAKLILDHVHIDRRYYDEINEKIKALRKRAEEEIEKNEPLKLYDVYFQCHPLVVAIEAKNKQDAIEKLQNMDFTRDELIELFSQALTGTDKFIVTDVVEVGQEA